MDDSLTSWLRPHFTPTGREADVFCLIYGRFDELDETRLTDYRTTGLPPEVSFDRYARNDEREVMATYGSSLWKFARVRNPRAANAAARAPEFIKLYGSIPDPETLDYLRDVVGYVMYLLDSGGVAVFDIAPSAVWTPEEWRRDFYRPGAPVPSRHVWVTDAQAEDGSTVYRTLGMRKFGRPDMNVRRVGRRYRTAVSELLERYIEFQAFGGTIRPGERVILPGSSKTGRAQYVTDPNYPDFREVKFEWPDGALDRPWWQFW